MRASGTGHVAARSKRTRRNVALCSCARRHVLSTECILSLVGARSIEASACLSFGTTGTTPWPRWRRLPLSSSLSWWLPALLRWQKSAAINASDKRLIWGRRRQTGHLDQPRKKFAQQINDAPLPLIGWSGRAPAPPAIEAGKGRQRRGARNDVARAKTRYLPRSARGHAPDDLRTVAPSP